MLDAPSHRQRWLKWSVCSWSRVVKVLTEVSATVILVAGESVPSLEGLRPLPASERRTGRQARAKPVIRLPVDSSDFKDRRARAGRRESPYTRGERLATGTTTGAGTARRTARESPQTARTGSTALDGARRARRARRPADGLTGSRAGSRRARRSTGAGSTLDGARRSPAGRERVYASGRRAVSDQVYIPLRFIGAGYLHILDPLVTVEVSANKGTSRAIEDNDAQDN